LHLALKDCEGVGTEEKGNDEIWMVLLNEMANGKALIRADLDAKMVGMSEDDANARGFACNATLVGIRKESDEFEADRTLLVSWRRRGRS
jgi:hypothetical protein